MTRQTQVFGLVADYLRACRAGFDDIIDLLHAYTVRRNVVEHAGDVAVQQALVQMPAEVVKEVVRKDREEVREVVEKKRLPPSPEARAARARGAAVRAWWRKHVRRRVVVLWEEHHWHDGLLAEETMKAYACEVWTLLARHRDHDPAGVRALLDAALGRMLAGSSVRPEVVRAVHDDVAGMYYAAIEAGGLAAVAAASGSPAPAARGPKMRFAPRREEKVAQRARFIETARPDIVRLLEDAGVEPGRVEAWVGVVRSLCTIADSTVPGSDARQAQLDELADAGPISRRWRRPELVRKLAGVIMPLWDGQKAQAGG